MEFSEFTHNLLTGQKFSYPEKLSVPADAKSGLLSSKNIFWEKIYTMRKFTDSSADKFSDLHEGSTGWEYDMTMIYVDKRFFYSEIRTSKEYNTVTSSTDITFKMEHDIPKHTLKDIILINSKEAGSIFYKNQKEIDDRQAKVTSGKFIIGIICHFHSHPQIQLANSKQRIYTFFSRIDFASFLSTPTPLMGLVTDRLWLLVKTSNSRQIPGQTELHQLQQLEVNKDKRFIEACGDLMNRYEFALYTAEFGASKLTRLTSGAS